ncbi:MAG: sulfatase [Alphaproteobacteria bacterium]
MTDRPNILLVMTDQQRADTLSCLGSRHGRTPHFDALAARGILFERAFSPVPMCSPARASLWTGLQMSRHGIVTNVGPVPTVLDRLPGPTLFAALRAAGYRLGYLGKWHLGEADPGLFDHWEGYNSHAAHWVEGPSGVAYRAFLETDRAIALLDALDGDRPFCLVVSYYPPHPPYEPPPEYTAMHVGGPLPGYFGAVRAIDDCIGRLCGALDARGRWQRTAVLFCSDHAQVLAEREGGGRKRNLFDETLRIPMILVLPGGRAAGTRAAGMVGLLDVAPTLRALAGAAPAAECHGAGLAPFVARPDPPWRSTLLLQNRTRPDREASGAPREERAIRTDRAKLILGQGRRPRLYDLERDPGEHDDLLAGPTPPVAAAASLARALAGEAAAIGDAVGVALARSSFRAPA